MKDVPIWAFIKDRTLGPNEMSFVMTVSVVKMPLDQKDLLVRFGLADLGSGLSGFESANATRDRMSDFDPFWGRPSRSHFSLS